MYTVMIVDDEILARVGIKSMIDWGQHGYEVVGEAENGEKALKQALEINPDIIITDIKMPVLNGVELIREIVRQKLDTKFIVLSAYDDFEYVKEAMKAGAEDYLIKLELQPDQLLGILHTLKSKIKMERAEGHSGKRVDRHHERNISILRENFLRELLMGRAYTRQEIEEWIQYFEMTLYEDHLICYVIHPDSFEIYNKYTDDDVHLLDYAMLNLIDEMLLDYKMGYAVQTAEREITVLVTFENQPDEEIRKGLARLEKSIKAAMRTYLNLSITLGASNIQSGYLSIRHCYREASFAINKRFSFSQGSTICYEDVKSYTFQEIELMDEMKDLENALHIEDVDRVTRLLNIMGNKVKTTPFVSKENIIGFCSTLLFMVESMIGDRQASFPSAWKENSNKKLNQMASLADFSTWFEELEAVLTATLYETNETSRMIRNIKKYILHHYDKEISLEIIAQEMNLSANYLSNLFKKETKENLIEYVTKVRINRAIEYLRTTDLKIYEIGKLVGYENEHYFSRVFKKTTGVSPNRYRS